MRSLGELCDALGLKLHGDGALPVTGVAQPDQAGPQQIAPFTDPSRLAEVRSSRAGALMVREVMPGDGRPQILCGDDPGRALGLLLEALGAERQSPGAGVDPRAAVEQGAQVGAGAWIGPFAYVGAGATLGRESRIYPFCYVGAAARVGDGCRMLPGAVLMDGCSLDNGAVLGPGAVVGAEGFGFWRDEEGWRRVPCVGHVTVGEGSQIGANSCVDRGTLGDTQLGDGVMLDNLVQVGHNCRLDHGALLCGQTGLAGSVTVGQGAVLAGQVGVADHRTVGAGAMVGAMSGVSRDVAPGEKVTGYPAMPHRLWKRLMVKLARLAGGENKKQETNNGG